MTKKANGSGSSETVFDIEPKNYNNNKLIGENVNAHRLPTAAKGGHPPSALQPARNPDSENAVALLKSELGGMVSLIKF